MNKLVRGAAITAAGLLVVVAIDAIVFLSLIEILDGTGEVF